MRGARSRCRCAVLAALCLGALGAAPAWAGVDQSMDYQADAAHDGALSGPSSAGPLSQAWSRSFAGGVSYPVVAGGIVYATVGDAAVWQSGTGYGTTLVALDAATGATVWSHALGGTYYWSALAYDGGRVFAVNYDGLLTAFDAVTGTIDWSAQLPGQYSFTSAPSATGGVVYDAGAGDGGTLYANDERTGALVWKDEVANGDDSSPAVDDGHVYVTYPDNYYAFDRLTGPLAWGVALGGDGGGGRTAVVAAGHVYVRDPVASNRILSAQDGSTQGPLGSTTAPAVGGGVAYEMVGATLEAVAGNGLGSVTWSFAGDGQLDTAPLLVGDTVYVGSATGQLYALDPESGTVAWSTTLDQPITRPDEMNVSQPLTGLGAGGGALFVPAGDTLDAYARPAAGAPPVNELAPSIEGDPRSGEQVAADVGAWTNRPTAYHYVWKRCDPAGDSCGTIAGESSSIYAATAGDAGQTLRVEVTATNDAGDGDGVLSPATAPVLPALPASTHPPTISGPADVGGTLTADPGTWSGSPTGFAYQWEECQGPNCEPIDGATATTFVPGSAQLDYQLQVAVTASNAGGPSWVARSAPTGAIAPGLPTPGPGAVGSPVNDVPPTILGTPAVGTMLDAIVGVWTGSVDLTVQWLRCVGSPLVCAYTNGENPVSYVPVADDVGASVMIEVTATNSSGSTIIYSNPVGPIASGGGAGSQGAAPAAGSGAPPATVTPQAPGLPAAPGTPTPAPTPAPGAASPETTPAGPATVLGTASLTTPHGLTGLLRSGLGASVRCRASCRVAVTVMLAGTARSHAVTVVGGVRHSLVGGRTARLRVALTRSGSRALAGRKTATLTVDITFTAPSGRTSTIVRTLRV
ncbi:MAG TPA: PQQ-binding-like beta-propeller repeat protein [Solirubrobacteraceae bacterium]